MTNEEYLKKNGVKWCFLPEYIDDVIKFTYKYKKGGKVIYARAWGSQQDIIDDPNILKETVKILRAYND